jgi:hypothetical protein
MDQNISVTDQVIELKLKNMKIFYVKCNLRRDFFSGNEMRLTFKRKLSRSLGSKAAVITIPRPIALAWQEHDTVDMVFDGECLVILPSEGT